MLDHFAKLPILGYVVSLTLLVCNPLWADDTEIFFGRTNNSETNPNILFVLDASNSMRKYDCRGAPSSWTSCEDGTQNGTTTRLARMQNSLQEIINSVSDVNVGLMRFSTSDNGGRIIYPIMPIDNQICGGQPCDADSIFTAKSRPAESSDDAAQQVDGQVTLDENSITLMKPAGIPLGNTWVGLRFPELKIPQGATITEAHLDLSSVSASETTSNLIIYAENSTDAAPFTSAHHNVSSRDRTSDFVRWDAIPEWVDGGDYESPDISNLVQTVVSQADWCGGKAMGLLISGSGERLISASDAGDSNRPVLRVSYKLDNIPATGGCTRTTVVRQVSDPVDDANELDHFYNSNSNHGRVFTGHSTTEISTATLQYKWAYNSAIRFTNVSIPQDSEIIDASITLTTREMFAGNGAVKFSVYPGINIHAEDNANPAAISGSKFNISNRTITSPVLWSASDIPIANETKTTTSSLTTLVQGLVGKDDWNTGNSMLFVLKAAGAGGQGFHSRNSDASKAPSLKITFESKIRSAEDISGPVTDVRSELVEAMNDIDTTYGTPTVGAMFEAKQYFSGGTVEYGKQRYLLRTDSRIRNSRVSSPNSYTGGIVLRDPLCRDNDLDSEYCIDERIDGTPRYISPITHECQSNHIVVLTDGYPTEEPSAINSISTLLADTCDPVAGEGGECAEELAAFMHTNDQHITTHTLLVLISEING